jgi:hypothetical protein
MMDWEEWALDLIILPLSLILSVDSLTSETEEVLLGACDVLERSKKVAAEVSLYRKYIAKVLSGESLEDAYDELTGDLMR